MQGQGPGIVTKREVGLVRRGCTGVRTEGGKDEPWKRKGLVGPIRGREGRKGRLERGVTVGFII